LNGIIKNSNEKKRGISLETRNNTYICYTLSIEKERQNELIDFFDTVFFDTNYQIISDIVEADVDVSHGTIYADALDHHTDFKLRFYIERTEQDMTQTKLKHVPTSVAIVRKEIEFSESDVMDEYQQSFMLTDTCEIIFHQAAFSAKDALTQIILQPKNAFGTGSHMSTQIAAQLLEQYAQLDDVLVDVGTGTGILAMYGAKRGIKHVLAVDSDPVSVLEATKNADVNGVSDQVVIKQNDFLTNIDLRPFTLIIANLSLNLYPPFLTQLRAKMQGNERFIFSGVMESEQHIFETMLNEIGFVVHDKLVVEAWVGYYVRNSK